MTLEHYPAMTEKALAGIAAEAERRWPIIDGTIIHRVGRLEPGARIVLVAVSSSHRAAALEACAFLIDWLKTKAPFWKLEELADGGRRWVDARTEDDRSEEHTPEIQSLMRISYAVFGLIKKKRPRNN